MKMVDVKGKQQQDCSDSNEKKDFKKGRDKECGNSEQSPFLDDNSSDRPF